MDNGFDALQEGLASGDVELRMRLPIHLRELIDKIGVFSRGHRKVHDPDELDEAIKQVRSKPEGKKLPFHQLLRHPVVREAADGEDCGLRMDAGMIEASPKAKITKEMRRYIEAEAARAMTKEGRFLRVHFKTGQMLDLRRGQAE